MQMEFEREFSGHLERLREPVIEALGRIVSTEPPGAFDVLSFEIQADWRKFPVRAFAMDHEAVDELYFEAPFCGPVLPPDAGPLVPKGAINQDQYEAAGVATFETGARVLAEWFGKCWDSAGGAAFPLPAYINFLGSSRCFHLQAHKWVKAESIGQESGSI